MKYIWKNVLDMPPSWLVLFLVITWEQAMHAPFMTFRNPLLSDLGIALMLAGGGLMLWAFLFFRRLRTSVVPRRQPTALIDRGPYRFTRNPIYLADTAVLLGFSLWQGALLGVLLVPVFMKLIEIRFIRGEEAGLRQEFPDESAEFFRRTRRWL